MNIYDVNHVNDDIHEIEAEFFERQDEEWAFYAGGVEVFRVELARRASCEPEPHGAADEGRAERQGQALAQVSSAAH